MSIKNFIAQKMSLTTVLLLWSALNLALLSEDRYATSANFLNMDIGAGPAALSGSGSALNLDSDVFIYNPGTSAFVAGEYLTYSHAFLNNGIDLDFFSFFSKIKKFKYSISITYLHSLFELFSRNSEKIGEAISNDLNFCFSLARLFLKDRLGAGINLKYIRQSMYTFNANLIAADIGFTLNVLQRRLILALALRNVGINLAKGQRKIQLNPGSTAAANFPVNIKIGASYKLLEKSSFTFTSTLDIDKYLGMPIILKTGFHLSIRKWLGLKGGYLLSSTDNNLFSFGLDVHLSLKKADSVIFGYAFLPSPVGASHYTTLKFQL